METQTINLIVPRGWLELNDNCSDNLYQGYLHTKNDSLIDEIIGKRCRWFSKKYYSSVMNIRDFFADNLGREFQGIIADSFDDKTFRRKH